MGKNNETLWGIIIAVIAGIILAALVVLMCEQDQANKNRLSELHAGELAACWQEVQGSGGTCRIEYLKDRTDTIYGAKVIREAK